MTDVDPFDEGVPRGRYGRPLIIPLGRGGKPNTKGQLVEYDRASTVADALDTDGGLATWRTRTTALAIAKHRDLAALVAALGDNINTLSGSDKTALDAIIERAHDRAGGNEKADYGTAVHSLTEPGNTGDAITDGMARDVVSYLATIDEAGIEVEATETFVVNDDLKVAGTFDHAYRFTRDLEVTLNGEQVKIPAGTKVIGDKKTGSLHFDAHAIQLAIYARGKIYDHRTGERGALDVSPQWGVVAHIGRDAAKTTLYLVDLAAGWQGAKLATQVRAYTLGARKRLSVAIASCEAPAAAVAPGEAAPGKSEVTRAAVAAELAASADPFDTPAPPQRHTSSEPDDVTVEIDEFAANVPAESTPAAQSDTTVADAVANLARAGLQPVEIDPVLDDISRAANPDACKTIWSDYCRKHGPAAWRDEYTQAVKDRIAKLTAAAA